MPSMPDLGNAYFAGLELDQARAQTQLTVQITLIGNLPGFASTASQDPSLCDNHVPSMALSVTVLCKVAAWESRVSMKLSGHPPVTPGGPAMSLPTKGALPEMAK